MATPPLKPLMFAGTGSDVGKTLLTAGFCRLFRQEGYHPAPFKAQNMSLNSYATPDGFEISRAQAMQAEAAGIPCSPEMNPVLLKPSGNRQSQVILNGKPSGVQNAYDYYHQQELHEQRYQTVCKAFDKLAQAYNPIIMEGAGSISELNLKQKDIANMAMAKYANAAVLLVADIDRGGIFGSIYGSIALLNDDERSLIKGIVVNKFRGDIRLFDEGRKILEDITQVPVLGVLPYLEDIYLDEEDSMALRKKNVTMDSEKVKIAVPLLDHLSNFTDFNRLERDFRVNLYYTKNPEELEEADIIIIPGSKNTITDLINLKNNGLAQTIYQHHEKGKTVMGICGGYQMMGQWVADPDHVEGKIEGMPGIGLLPVTTRLQPEKTTEQREFYFNGLQNPLRGYEIHMGETSPVKGEGQPIARFIDDQPDGYKASEHCWGTYIHGILDNQTVIDHIINPYLKTNTPIPETEEEEQIKDAQYNRLADMLRKSIDLGLLKAIMEEK